MSTPPITARFSPEIFIVVPMSTLSKRHFDSHPVWSEYYDFEERNEIIGWGVDPDWLAEELERVYDGNDHCAYPILQPYPLPNRMRLYIQARLESSDGIRLGGYVMNDDAFALTIFLNDAEFTFSRHRLLRDLADEELARLRIALGNPRALVFPIRYETDFLDNTGKRIAGEFSTGNFPS